MSLTWRSTAEGLEKTALGRLEETIFQNECRVTSDKSGTRAQGVVACVGSKWANSWPSLTHLKRGCVGSKMSSSDKMASCACWKIAAGGSGEIKKPSWINTIDSIIIKDCSISRSLRGTVLPTFSKMRNANPRPGSTCRGGHQGGVVSDRCFGSWRWWMNLQRFWQITTSSLEERIPHFRNRYHV